MMGMHGVLITLSPKRLAQIEEDPETLDDVLDARHETEIPGLLDVGKVWDALDVIISERGKDAILGDALLARTGRPIGNDQSIESCRLLEPPRVAEVAKRLEGLAPTHVKEKYSTLSGAKVHGKFGETPDDEEREGLEIVLSRVIAFYKDAAKQKHSVLVVIE
jgi:hypothetical protein